MSRFSRNEALFGAAGQAIIERTAVAICGLGGLGSHVVQQLVYLGVRRFILIDFDLVSSSSLNRLIGAVEADVDRTPKVDVGARMIAAVRPDSMVRTLRARVADPIAESALSEIDVIIGCLDKDIHRLELLGCATALGKPYFDLATDVVGDGGERYYGGRVLANRGEGCLVCLPELLDQEAIARDRLDPAALAVQRRIYGVSEDSLDGTGPAVVSINGVVASLGVTEFMAHVAGLREPLALTYRGETGVVRRSRDQGDPDCVYCGGFRRARAASEASTDP
jgi:molybdopterin-synthase adenylyltransferase